MVPEAGDEKERFWTRGLEGTGQCRLPRWLTCGTRSIRDSVSRNVRVLLFIYIHFVVSVVAGYEDPPRPSSNESPG